MTALKMSGTKNGRAAVNGICFAQRAITLFHKFHNALGQRGAACGASAAPTGCASKG